MLSSLGNGAPHAKLNSTRAQPSLTSSQRRSARQTQLKRELHSSPSVPSDSLTGLTNLVRGTQAHRPHHKAAFAVEVEEKKRSIAFHNGHGTTSVKTRSSLDQRHTSGLLACEEGVGTGDCFASSATIQSVTIKVDVPVREHRAKHKAHETAMKAFTVAHVMPAKIMTRAASILCGGLSVSQHRQCGENAGV